MSGYQAKPCLAIKKKLQDMLQGKKNSLKGQQALESDSDMTEIL